MKSVSSFLYAATQSLTRWRVTQASLVLECNVQRPLVRDCATTQVMRLTNDAKIGIKY